MISSFPGFLKADWNNLPTPFGENDKNPKEEWITAIQEVADQLRKSEKKTENGDSDEITISSHKMEEVEHTLTENRVLKMMVHPFLTVRFSYYMLGGGPDDAKEVMNHPFFLTVNWDDVYHKRIKPPFKPVVKSDTDVSNFDEDFTNEPVDLSPADGNLPEIAEEDEASFQQFS
ncbi:Protein kinase C-like [Acropora cervicornis]|uniref:Protein kinase C-like n=1 Tax=Acropora cervicornis TaxID=6130 RepID=A0AAD9QFR9_ACRCE|nr:Protein kinase C-like [Acropora cervicornis]